MKPNSIIYIITAGILLAACSHKQINEQNTEAADNLITVTDEQFATGNLSIGEPLKMAFEDVVRCNGSIVTEPSGNARIGTPVQGIVKRINCSGGQYVSQGQVLFELSGNEFIELQRELAETASQLIRLKSEYLRIKSLYDEKIGTEKDLIQAESEFKASNAKLAALKMKIKSLGLDEPKIESGDFYESFSLKSPINGYVSQVNVSIGQYADLQTTLAEVFDPGRFRLKLAVFEKDFGNLKEKQNIRFNLLGDTGKFFSATLRSIGKNVDEGTKTIICYAGIDESDGSRFVNNAYVEATIITKTDSVMAVPEESILKSEGSNYVLEFVRHENNIYYLKRTKAETGRLNKGFTEVLNLPADIKLVSKGAYNIKIE
jgi:cobalt-zinc-cadmium efflux system membrane fusion protein